MNFLKELLALQEQEPEKAVSASDVKVDDEVHSQLDKAEKEDDMDAQCFGLEMEDGKVVKVYVKQEDAEEFEEAMSKRLGEDDDIETALEELGKDFEILEIKWPDEEDEESEEDGEAEEDEEDGGESLNPDVNYDDTAEETPKQEQRLSVGQRFAKRLTELKWDDEESSEYERARNEANPRGSEEEETEGGEDIPDEVDGDPRAPKPEAPQATKSSWKIDKDEKGGMAIGNDRFSIELDDDETLQLMNAITDKKIARFKNEHGKVVYVFSPKGSEYVLKTPEYQGGFRLPKDVVDKILDN
jgi:hypothetical protein